MDEYYKIYRDEGNGFKLIDTCDKTKADTIYKTSRGHILAIRHINRLNQDEPYFNVYNNKFSINTAIIENGEIKNAQNINIDMQDCIEIPAYDTKKEREEEER